MTERIADPQDACPFVAFDDDRDFRAPVPDHRHRCFAESPAAPRALAHQAAYCLSSAFPGCPTFIDWARREAAPPKVESPVRSLRDAGATPRVAASRPPGGAPPAGSAASRPPTSDADWTAPPPWGLAAGAATGAAAGAAGGAAEGAAASAPGAAPGGHDAEAAAGAPADAADGVDSGAAAWADPAPSRPDGSPSHPDGSAATAAPVAGSGSADRPAFLAGRGSRPAPRSPDEAPDPWAVEAGGAEPPLGAAGFAEAAGSTAPRPAVPPRVPVGYTPVGYAPVPAQRSDRRSGSEGRERHDAAAPSWEQPRRFEEYPSLKSRGPGGLPRPAVYALVVLLVGVGLFATPFVLRGLGGGDGGAGPTPSPSASSEPTAEPTPTPEPTPTEVVYIVKSNDTLSKIAAKYGVTVDQILEANPSIKNPNRIAVGDRIVIPQPLPSEIVDGAITPAP